MLFQGHVVLSPWIYIVDVPHTDSGGWIYKPSFSNQQELPKPNLLTHVRSRKWRRVSVLGTQYARAIEQRDQKDLDTSRYNAYHLRTISRALSGLEKKIPYSLQIVCESRRLRTAPSVPAALGHLAKEQS